MFAIATIRFPVIAAKKPTNNEELRKMAIYLSELNFIQILGKILEYESLVSRMDEQSTANIN